jgi:endonuclease/exonuclease/phosphatase family metal-dependent hydrolase
MNVAGKREPWPSRKRRIRDILSGQAPDLVALQEVLRPQGTGVSQADELAAGLGYRTGFSKSLQILRPFPSDLGNAVLSRFPFREHRTELLPGTESPRSLLYVLCSVKNGLLPLYVTQLSAEPGAAAALTRREQLLHIVHYIATEQAALPGRVPAHIPILPPMLLGELGSSPDSTALRFLTEAAGFSYSLVHPESTGILHVRKQPLLTTPTESGPDEPAGLLIDIELSEEKS